MNYDEKENSEEVKNVISFNSLMAVIKFVRMVSGIGLREAKILVDLWYAGITGHSRPFNHVDIPLKNISLDLIVPLLKAAEKVSSGKWKMEGEKFFVQMEIVPEDIKNMM